MTEPHAENVRVAFPQGSLWKYLSVAPNQTPAWQDRLRQLAVEGRAYFPSPQDFNDPFDCLPHVQTPATREEIERGQEGLIRRMAEAMPGVPPEVVGAELRKALAGQTLESLSAAIVRGIAQTSSEMGVFCLAERIDSVLMWSHYASNHRGIALQFDLRVQPRGGLPPMFKVHYSETRPSLGDFFDGFGPKDITDALITKAKFWEYEQEWRAFLPRGAGQIVEFDPEVVTGIAFGVNCTQADRAAVMEIVKGRRMSFFQAHPTHDTFDIRLAPA